MKRPPPISHLYDSNLLYDSCVNNISKPSIYVIFERDQCYPEYLITYVHQQPSHMNYYGHAAHSSHVPYQKKRKLKPRLTPKVRVVPRDTTSPISPTKRTAPTPAARPASSYPSGSSPYSGPTGSSPRLAQAGSFHGSRQSSLSALYDYQNTYPNARAKKKDCVIS